jgi:6,7-dimethyl-8-ribityllumazine synthase
MRVIQGSYDGTGLRIGVVVSRSNELLTKQLLVGALDGLRRNGVDKDAITVVYVPGISQLPLACRRLARRGSNDALIAVGVEIRGERGQHEATAAATGIATASLEAGVPIIFGVVAVDTFDNALERAGGRGSNRGFETALTAIEMARVLQALKE